MFSVIMRERGAWSVSASECDFLISTFTTSLLFYLLQIFLGYKIFLLHFYILFHFYFTPCSALNAAMRVNVSVLVRHCIFNLSAFIKAAMFLKRIIYFRCMSTRAAAGEAK